MNIGGHDIGVCSWSLQPKDTAELVAGVKELGLAHVQLALAPLLFLDDKRKHFELGQLRAAGITPTAGMISFPGEDYASIDAIRRTGGYVPDDQWELRKRMSQQAAVLGSELGLKAITTHVGFIPAKGQAGYDKMLGRVREIARDFSGRGIELGMETGQESAEELLEFLGDLNTPNVFVNFDPANMILYGAGDPIEAIRTLGGHVRHVHVKDGTASSKPGEVWGEEVAFGTGQVGPQRFLAAIDRIGYRGPLVIEREAGNQRAADVNTAIESLRKAASAS
jgi:sugar phosphate isomerase/epimerase